MFSWELVRHEMELSATPRPGQLPTRGTIQQRIETLMHMQPHNDQRLSTLNFRSDAETQPWPAIAYSLWIQEHTCQTEFCWMKPGVNKALPFWLQQAANHREPQTYTMQT